MTNKIPTDLDVFLILRYLHPDIYISPDDDSDVQIVNGTLQGWNEEKLGPRPSQAEFVALLLDAAPAVLAQVAATEQRTAAQDAGIQWNGHTIPLHRDDALTLLQVKAAFELGETQTVIEFSNSEKVPVTAEQFASLAMAFSAARNSLFQDVE